jgi:hypothetical protein
MRPGMFPGNAGDGPSSAGMGVWPCAHGNRPRTYGGSLPADVPGGGGGGGLLIVDLFLQILDLPGVLAGILFHLLKIR